MQPGSLDGYRKPAQLTISRLGLTEVARGTPGSKTQVSYIQAMCDHWLSASFASALGSACGKAVLT